ncbi:hypothetical protein IJI99_00590 [bacterium]|nr:hypothetical protein [bacterium]
MSSQVCRFKVGERVSYPHISFGPEGRHQVVKDSWLVKAIFPVSRLALITQTDGPNAPCIHVDLDRLSMYN